jgi:hypothetical protein
VRPANPVEMQRDGECIWTTSPYEPQLLKLNRGTQVGRDDREWTYGQSYAVLGMQYLGADD